MATNARAELLAKIKKCLALAKSANEHEAAAALATARRLIDEHGIDQADVDLIDVGERVAKGGGAWTPWRWETHLKNAVTRAIPCETILLGDDGWAFIGLTPAPEIAAYAFSVLYRQLKRARATYIAQQLRRVKSLRRKTARADAFAEGWAIAVQTKIAKLYAKRPVDELVRGYIERRYPNTSTLQPRAAGATGSAVENDRGRGWMAGHDVDLHQGVGASAAPLKLGTTQGRVA